METGPAWSSHVIRDANLIGVGTVVLLLVGVDDGSGRTGTSGGTTGGDSGTIKLVSSLPRTGLSKPQTDDIVAAYNMAIEERGGKVGNFTVVYEDWDDATAQAGKWDPATEQANATKAANDPDIMAYLGTFNSGAAKIAIPILNKAGLAMVSPANTAVGLTTNQPGSNPGEPDKYYPAGTRNYTRIVPKDTIQGAALATVMKEDAATDRAGSAEESAAAGQPGIGPLRAALESWRPSRIRGARLRSDAVAVNRSPASTNGALSNDREERFPQEALDGLKQLYATDVVSFDVEPPLQHRQPLLAGLALLLEHERETRKLEHHRFEVRILFEPPVGADARGNETIGRQREPYRADEKLETKITAGPIRYL